MQKSKSDFYSLVQDIIDNKEFDKLKNELHHGITRYDHSMRVAKWTYKIGKKCNMSKTIETTRAALLHDFYINEELKDNSGLKNLKIHPNQALINSMKHFDLNEMQQDIIKTHMFPCTLNLPKYKESWLVSGVDKVAGLYEMIRYKLSLYLGIYLLFLFNVLTIPR